MDYVKFTPAGKPKFKEACHRGSVPLGVELRMDEFLNLGFVLKNTARYRLATEDEPERLGMIEVLITPITIHSLFDDFQFSFNADFLRNTHIYPFRLMNVAEIAKARLYKPFYEEKEDEY